MKHSFLAAIGVNDMRLVLEDRQKKRSRHATRELPDKPRWTSSRTSGSVGVKLAAARMLSKGLQIRTCTVQYRSSQIARSQVLLTSSRLSEKWNFEEAHKAKLSLLRQQQYSKQ